MGILKKLFGGADGIRETMCDAYEKNLRRAEDGEIPLIETPHSHGLYGALSTRYKARLKSVPEVVIWFELCPFLLMKKNEAVEALAEYVVYKERPSNARVTWLKELVNSSISLCENDEQMAVAVGGFLNKVAWCALLDQETKKTIENAVERFTDS